MSTRVAGAGSGLDVLRGCDAADWPAVRHLPPEEKSRLAPRLLGPGKGFGESPLWGLALEPFHLRDELVDADGKPGAGLVELSPDFSVRRAREMVAPTSPEWGCCGNGDVDFPNIVGD